MQDAQEEEQRTPQEAREHSKAQEVREERRAQEAGEKEVKAQEERNTDRVPGGARKKGERSGGAREARKRGNGPRLARRRKREARCVEEEEEETNSMQEENHVSNRHMMWWQRSWWVHIDNGPHLRTARGRRRAWRAGTRGAREMRVTEETHCESGETERERDWGSGEEEKTTRCTSCCTYPPTHLHQPNGPSNGSNSSNSNLIRFASEIAFQPIYPAIGVQLHSERFIAVREIELRFHALEIEVCERNVLSGFRVHSNIN